MTPHARGDATTLLYNVWCLWWMVVAVVAGCIVYGHVLRAAWSPWSVGGRVDTGYSCMLRYNTRKTT